MRQSAIVLAIVPALACGGASPTAPATPTMPTRSQLTPVVSTAEWPAAAPDSEGVNAQSILDLAGRIGRGEYGSVSSLLLVRHGQLIVEEYFGWSASRAHTVQSVTKSVTSLLAGMAIDRGRLSIADHAVDFFPGYRPIANLDER